MVGSVDRACARAVGTYEAIVLLWWTPRALNHHAANLIMKGECLRACDGSIWHVCIVYLHVALAGGSN